MDEGYEIACSVKDGARTLYVAKCPKCKLLALEDDMLEHMKTHTT